MKIHSRDNVVDGQENNIIIDSRNLPPFHLEFIKNLRTGELNSLSFVMRMIRIGLIIFIRVFKGASKWKQASSGFSLRFYLSFLLVNLIIVAKEINKMGYIHSVSEMQKRSKGIVKIGDTIFIDGSPFVECAKCGVPIKLAESKKITVGYWPRKEAEYITNETTGEWELKEDTPKPPKLRKAHGCVECSNIQLQEQADNNWVAKRGGKQFTAFFETKECDGNTKTTLNPGRFPIEKRKEYK